MGGVIAVVGIGMVALPAAILVSGYFEQKEKTIKCPHCRKIIGR